MRLEGNFYNIDQIETLENNSYIVKATLVPNHKIYEGHFPAQPVVPGVCTLTVIRECIGKILSREVSFRTIKECKYLSALIPEKEIGIVIAITLTDENKIMANVERADNQQNVLKLKAEII